MHVSTVVIISVIAIAVLVFVLYFQHWRNNKKAVIPDSALSTIDPAPFLERAKDREAKIISVHPREVSGTDPKERIVKFRLAIKEDGDNYVTHTVKWKIANFILADFRQGNTIHVMVCDNYVFPEVDGAKLISESMN